MLSLSLLGSPSAYINGCFDRDNIEKMSPVIRFFRRCQRLDCFSIICIPGYKSIYFYEENHIESVIDI